MYEKLRPWMQYAGLLIFCYLAVRAVVRDDEIGGTIFLIAVISQLKMRWD